MIDRLSGGIKIRSMHEDSQHSCHTRYPGECVRGILVQSQVSKTSQHQPPASHITPKFMITSIEVSTGLQPKLLVSFNKFHLRNEDTLSDRATSIQSKYLD